MFFLPQLFSSVLFLAAVVILTGEYRRLNLPESGERGLRVFKVFRLRYRCVFLISFFIVAGGYHFSLLLGRAADRQLREELKNAAGDIVQALDINAVKKLAFAPEDEYLPEYRRISSQMAKITEYPGLGFRKVYTLKSKPGGFFFGPEGYRKNSSFFATPGTLYKKPPPLLEDVFLKKIPLSAGPYSDEYGRFISGFAPLIDPITGEVVVAVGVDADISVWKSRVFREQAFGMVFTLLLLTVFFAGKALLSLRMKLPEERQRPLRHVEAYIVLAAGLLITFCVARTAWKFEVRFRQRNFEAYGRAVIASMNQDIKDLHKSIYMLDSFFKASDYVDRREFHEFASTLLRDGVAHVWGWIPCVPASDVKRLEQQAEREGIDGYSVFERDNAGVRVLPSGRETCYPIFYRESTFRDYEGALGYDIGSSPVRLAALETAAETGLCTSTEPLKFFALPGSPQGLLILRHVRSKNHQGFILAGVTIENLVGAALNRIGGREMGLYADILYLKGKGVGEPFFSSLGEKERASQNRFSVSAPVFAFGKTYAVNIYAGSRYIAANRLKNGAAAAAAGVLLTAALAFIAFFLSERQAAMERTVRLCTAELTEEIAERKKAQRDAAVQLKELERWHYITLGREKRIIELKKEVNELLADAGKPSRYKSTDEK